MPQQQSEPDARAALATQLNDLNAAEAALVTAMPKLVLAGSCIQFRTLLASHLLETEGQVARLKRAAKGINLSLETGAAPAIERLIAQAQRLAAEEAPPLTKDLRLTEAARAIERQEIAAYQEACTLADELAESDLKATLTKSLKEEESAERLLGTLAAEIASGAIHPTPPA